MGKYNKGALIYEGKAKKLYATEEVGVIIQSFKDDITAFNGEKKDVIKDKGIINLKISDYIFGYLSKNGIKTHLLETLNEREQRIKESQVIPLEVVVRNFAAGSIAKRLGYEEGREFHSPIVEFYYKNDDLGDPIINKNHILELKLASLAEIEYITNIALEINGLLSKLFLDAKLKLVDFKIEFGRSKLDNGQIILIDEISPDSCRLWKLESSEKLDKDVYRKGLGDITKTYREIMSHLGINE